MLAVARVRMFEGTLDEFYLNKPYYETKDSEPDYSVPELARLILKEKEQWKL